MDTHDWITAGSALLIVIGWFVSAMLTRSNNVKLKRLEFEHDAYSSYFTFWAAFSAAGKPAATFRTDPKLAPLFQEAKWKLELYCPGMVKPLDKLEELAASGIETPFSVMGYASRGRIRKLLKIR